MRDPPPEVIASWPQPNFENPDYQGPQLAVVGVFLVVLATLTLILRILVRVRMKKTAGWDDWIMVASMPVIIACTAISIVGSHKGWGYHIWDNRPEWASTSRLLSWCNQLLYVIIMVLVKVSLLTSYLRFSTTPWLTRFSWSLIIINILWGVAFTIALHLACRPLNLYWDSSTYEGVCHNEDARLISASIISILTDILVFVLPFSTFWKLRLPIREKIVLFTLMSMGVIACVSSIIRTYYIWKTTLLTYDVTWDGYNIWLWTVIEVNLAVICSSVPTLRPFVRKYFPNLGFKRSSDRSYGMQISDWPNTQSGMEMSAVTTSRFSRNPPIQLHQEIPPVSTVIQNGSNSSGKNSVEVSKGSWYAG